MELRRGPRHDEILRRQTAREARVGLGTESPVRGRRERGRGSLAERGTAARLALRPLAAALLLGIAGLLFLPAQAAAQSQKLVSNLGETFDASNSHVVGSSEPSQWSRSQAFTTGSGTSTITSVQIDIRQTAGTNYNPKVSIFTDASGSPGTSLATLTDPDSKTDGLNTFAPASSLSLSANTTYHVVIEATSRSFGVRSSDSDSEGSDGTVGWSIADSHRGRFEDSGTWSSTSEVLRIRIDGTFIVDPTDATLSALSIENAANDTGINFNERFASDTTSYTASVANSVSQITVKPTTNVSDATVAYLDASNSTLADADTVKPGHQVSLSEGSNTVKVKVTAEDTTTTQTYTVTVTRAAADLSTDKTLSALSIANAEDNSAISFDQTFASNVQSYTASVSRTVAQITVSATTNHSGASIAYLNASNNTLADADTDQTGHQVDLRRGSNEIKVRVTAEDNVSTKTYVITVHRARIRTGPATGQPTISGPVQVGRTVEALSGSIGDEDGIEGGFSYQWIRVNDSIETEIQGATSNTYTLAQADSEKKIKVRLSFTDGKGNAEARTSEATRKVVRKQHNCSSRRNADWCTRLWTPVHELRAGPTGKFYGYLNVGKFGKGELLDDSIEYSGTTVTVGEIGIYDYDKIRDEVVVGLKGSWLPDASVFNIGGTRFEADEGKTNVLGVYAWPLPPGFRWLDGQFVTVSVRIRHRAYLSVSDTEASEDNDPSLDFVVNLTSGASGPVTVNYATSDGTATAGVDYEATSGQLTFARRERTKTVSVPIIDDNIEDSGETVILTLSDATGTAVIQDGTAVGTILNTEATTVAGLTASFRRVPERHDGTSRFTFQVALSEELADGSGRKLRRALSASGGAVELVRRVGEARDLYVIEMEPTGDDDVIVSLGPSSEDCTAKDAVCTSDGTPLSAAVSAAVQGPREPLTAVFQDVPAEHDGSTSFTVRLAFSEELASGSGRKVGSALTLTGARRGPVVRVANGRDLYSFAVHPSGNGAVTLSLSASATDCTASSAVCTPDGRMLSAAVSATVQSPREPLTAVFQDVPAEHDGSTSFTVRLAFSEELASGSGRKAGSALTLTGARRGNVTRVGEGRDLYSFAVHPSGNGAVTLSLSASATDCATSSAVCTPDGRVLSAPVSATAQGPPGLSVEDAEVDEADNAQLSFKVKLGRTASDTVTVEYSTSDVTATAGADYTSTSGTLSFSAGETEKTVSVTVLDDSHDDDGETLTLTLSNASGAYLADATATGTINNSDPLPRALMARFGRAAAVHVVEHVEERLQARREPGFRGRFAGRELRRGMERDVALGFLQGLGSLTGHPAGPAGGALPGMPGAPVGSPGLAAGSSGMAAGPLGAVPRSGLGGPGMAPAGSMAAGSMAADPGLGRGSLGGRALSMGLGGGDPLAGSAFALNRETHGGVLSFWSRGAQSHFSGREGELSLGGDVRTTMFGADYARGPLVAGLSLSHSRGLGEYAGASRGQVASAVTGLYPWLGYKATERVTVWGTAGYGAGAMLVTLDGGPALETGLSMAMAAAGTRGELVAGGAGGFALAFKADALWVGTASDGVDGPTGRLAATEAAVTRVRTGLEGSRAYTLGGRLSLKPVVEVGLRHDGGDAETGAGMDIGGGLVASDAATGLAVDVRVRTLVLHQAEGFRERGVALSVSYTPTPSTPLGFTARVAPSWGGRATSGAEALWGRETMAGMANGGVAAGDRLDAEVGYGLPVGSRLVGTPRVGVATSEHGRDYRLGYGMTMLQTGSTRFQLGVDAQRRESALRHGADHAVLGRATVGW